jgi:hypothetical protein
MLTYVFNNTEFEGYKVYEVWGHNNRGQQHTLVYSGYSSIAHKFVKKKNNNDEGSV